MKGIRITGAGISGANLTWLYFKEMCDKNWEQIEKSDYKRVKALFGRYERGIPMLAQYTAMWDTFSWDKKLEKYVKYDEIFEALEAGNENGLEAMVKQIIEDYEEENEEEAE